MTWSADQVVLRPPTLADIEAAACCHMSCWQEAYAQVLDRDRLAEITSDLDWARNIWRGCLTSDRTAILAAEGDHILGFAIAGPASEPGLDVDFQLNAINVRRAYWGTGVGQRLVDATVGDRAAFLWVFRDNPQARGFYARNGFIADGAEQVEDLFGAVEIRMVRRARSRSSSSANA